MNRTTATRFYSELSILCAVEILWSNKSCLCVCAYFVLVCVSECVLLFSLLLFATETLVCSSHCQSQITNDTNSPRALTISTLAQLTLSSREHAHRPTHAHTHWLRTQSLTRSLALSHTHERKQREEARHDEAKPDEEDEAIQLPISSRYHVRLKCDCVCECVCVWGYKKN